MSDTMQFWWCGWEVPYAVPDTSMVLTWPRCMLAWHTGDGLDYATWVGLVWAESAERAMEIVRGCYTDHRRAIRTRWTPQASGQDWTGGDRFNLTPAQVAALKVGGAA